MVRVGRGVLPPSGPLSTLVSLVSRRKACLVTLASLYIPPMSNDKKLTTRIGLMMSPAEVRELDAWAHKNRVRGRSEAMRHLIKLGMQAAAAKPKDKAPA